MSETAEQSEFAVVELTDEDVRVLETIATHIDAMTAKLVDSDGNLLTSDALRERLGMSDDQWKRTKKELMKKGAIAIWSSGSQDSFILNQRLYEIPRENIIFDFGSSVIQTFSKRIQRPELVWTNRDLFEDDLDELESLQDGPYVAFDGKAIIEILSDMERNPIRAYGLLMELACYADLEDQVLKTEGDIRRPLTWDEIRTRARERGKWGYRIALDALLSHDLLLRIEPDKGDPYFMLNTEYVYVGQD